ncbi:trimeric intracellular cation channel family protein [Candidatus Sulfurimonas baltica]|uniref:Trimeric intracellular cation channel family protein n=1 Tax=Candidatus Sulfurimonas baltica TaxID=2740404 RepID=A0A7S7RNL0_9BACT|nr:trimeric intracellular cation channel family protein [Candidatus Sulfurimonas baltica]QOY52661.1 trimeric intracellular cation channel family protein [Candidatus Sulfurimonas baltica]
MQYTVFLDIIGTIAFALSGYILAAKAKYDILGILVIAFITAFGGGVVRDLLVDRMPYIFHKTYPITIVVITIIAAYIFKLHKNTTLTHNFVFIISDSIGLSIFAFTGAIVALESGFNLAGIMFLSFLTAVGGGIIRDMIMNKVPFVLKNDFYGTVAFILGFLVWLLSTLNLLNSLSTIILLIFGVIMRLMAIKFKWKLPKLI